MKVLNARTGAVLAERAEIADTARRRLLGLMFRRRLDPGSALVIIPCNGIHTCFMRFPIDVLFVSAEMRVLLRRDSIAPWRFIPIVRGARLVVELPAGTLRECPTGTGDPITFDNGAMV